MKVKLSIANVVFMVMGLVSTTAYAKGDEFSYCSNIVGGIFPSATQQEVLSICQGKSYDYSNCLAKAQTSTGFKDDLGDIKFGINNAHTAAEVCDISTSQENITCISQLFLRGGVAVKSKGIDAVSLCGKGYNKDLNSCIINYYQSKKISSAQAVTKCLSIWDADTRAQIAAQEAAQQQAQDQSQQHQTQQQLPAQPASTNQDSGLDDLPAL